MYQLPLWAMGLISRNPMESGVLFPRGANGPLDIGHRTLVLSIWSGPRRGSWHEVFALDHVSAPA